MGKKNIIPHVKDASLVDLVKYEQADLKATEGHLRKQLQSAERKLRKLRAKEKPLTRGPIMMPPAWKTGLVGLVLGATTALAGVPVAKAANDAWYGWWNPEQQVDPDNKHTHPVNQTEQREAVTQRLAEEQVLYESEVLPKIEEVKEVFTEDYERFQEINENLEEERELREERYNAAYTFKTSVQYHLAVGVENARFWGEVLGVQEWVDAVSDSSDSVDDWIWRQMGWERETPSIEDNERNVKLLELTLKLLEYTDRGAEAEAEALEAIREAFNEHTYSGENAKAVQELKQHLLGELERIVEENPMPHESSAAARQRVRNSRVEAFNDVLEQYGQENPDYSGVATQLADLCEGVESALGESDPHVDYLVEMQSQMKLMYELLNDTEQLRDSLSDTEVEEQKSRLDELNQRLEEAVAEAKQGSAPSDVPGRTLDETINRVDTVTQESAEEIDELREYGEEELGYQYPLTEDKQGTPWIFYGLLGLCAVGTAFACWKTYWKQEEKWVKRVGRKTAKLHQLQPSINAHQEEVANLRESLQKVDYALVQQRNRESKEREIAIVDSAFGKVESAYAELESRHRDLQTTYEQFMRLGAEFIKQHGDAEKMYGRMNEALDSKNLFAVYNTVKNAFDEFAFDEGSNEQIVAEWFKETFTSIDETFDSAEKIAKKERDANKEYDRLIDDLKSQASDPDSFTVIRTKEIERLLETRAAHMREQESALAGLHAEILTEYKTMADLVGYAGGMENGK